MEDEQAPPEHEADLLRRLARAVGPVPERVVEAAKAVFPATTEEPDSDLAQPAED